MTDIEDAGSIYDATETPRADVLRYAVAYPLVIALASVGVAATGIRVAATSSRLVAAGGLLVVMVVAFLAAAWVARPRDRTDVDMAAYGDSFRDEGAGRHDVLTSDAGQRFRVLAFGVGTALWGIGGLVAMFVALPAMGLV